MMDRSPRCYMPSFVEIGPPVQDNKIFEAFFTIYGRGGHLGHVNKLYFPLAKEATHKIWL